MHAEEDHTNIPQMETMDLVIHQYSRQTIPSDTKKIYLELSHSYKGCQEGIPDQDRVPGLAHGHPSIVARLACNNGPQVEFRQYHWQQCAPPCRDRYILYSS